MTKKNEAALVLLVSSLRPFDWSPEAVRGAIRRTVMEFGNHRDAGEIAIAAAACAMNPLNEHPNKIYGPGAHWDNLGGYLAAGSLGEDGAPVRVYASRRDREVLEEAAEASRARDPEVSRRGYLAAVAALRQPTLV